MITKWLWIKAKQLPNKFSFSSQGHFLTKFLLNVYVVPNKKFSMYISNNLLLFQKRAKFWSNNIQKTSMYIKSCRLEILLYSVTSQVYLIEKKRKDEKIISDEKWVDKVCKRNAAYLLLPVAKRPFFSNVCITASKLYIPSTINSEKTIFECIFTLKNWKGKEKTPCSKMINHGLHDLSFYCTTNPTCVPESQD